MTGPLTYLSGKLTLTLSDYFEDRDLMRYGSLWCKSIHMKPLLILLLALIGISAPAGSSESVQVAGPTNQNQSWFEKVWVGMEVGPTGAQFGYSDPTDTRYCAQFDGREMVRKALAAHSQYLVLWLRDGDFAYYNSSFLPKAPGLGTRDPLREAVEEAHRAHLPLIGYCVVQQGGTFLKAHPEWEMRSAEGKPIGRFCYNSGYLEAMKQMMSEQLAYGIDGFHVDMLDQGFGAPYGCWCESCKAQFEKQFGKPMPHGVTWDEDWDRMLEFRYQTSDQFEKALYAHVKSLRPNATVDFNYHGNPPFSWEVGQLPVRHADNADFVTGETGMWGFSALTVGLNAEFYRAATPGRRVQVAISRDARVYHNQTVRPVEDLRWELLTLLSHGVFVTTVDKTAFDGGLDPVAYDRVGLAYSDALKRQSHFGQQPLARVGLYFSSRSRDWMGREHAERYFQPFLGAHRALVYEHIPWGVILDENADLKTLRSYPVVLLPNVSIVSSRELALLEQYVSEGGKLLVVGATGCFDRMGKPLQASTLERLVGARMTGRLETEDNWVVFPGRTSSMSDNASMKWAPPGYSNRWFLVRGPALKYELTTAHAVGELWKPYRTHRQMEGKEGTEWPMSAEAVVGPAMLVNRVGQGMVITLAASPDADVASDHATAENRQWLTQAISQLDPNPRISISGPVTMESVVTEDPQSRTLRVHFIDYNAPAKSMPVKNRPYVLPGLIEDKPIFRVSVRLRETPKKWGVWNRSTQLRRNGTTLELVIEDVHDVLWVKY